VGIQREFRAMAESAASIRSIVMLNCGATTDLALLFSGDDGEALPPDVSVYVLDVTRPAYHGNVRKVEQVSGGGAARRVRCRRAARPQPPPPPPPRADPHP